MKEKTKYIKTQIRNIFLIIVSLLLIFPCVVSIASGADIDNIKKAPNIGKSVYIGYGSEYRIFRW